MKPVVAAVISLGFAAPAHAYVLYTSPSFPSVPLRWESRSTGFVMDSALPQEVAQEAAHTTLAASFDVWSKLSCNASTYGWAFADGGIVSGKTVGFDQTNLSENENLITWVKSGWPHKTQVVALTSLTYDLYTGRVVDADIEINDQHFAFSTNPATTEMDVMNTLVHEIGHFVGLDHSLIPKATMYSTAPVHETQKRDLTQDDIDGYCALYGQNAPPWPKIVGDLGAVATPEDCTESVSGNQTTIDCGYAPTPNNGCAATTTSGGSLTPWLSALLLSGAAARWRQRRARVTQRVRTRTV